MLVALKLQALCHETRAFTGIWVGLDMGWYWDGLHCDDLEFFHFFICFYFSFPPMAGNDLKYVEIPASGVCGLSCFFFFFSFFLFFFLKYM